MKQCMICGELAEDVCSKCGKIVCEKHYNHGICSDCGKGLE